MYSLVGPLLQQIVQVLMVSPKWEHTIISYDNLVQDFNESDWRLDLAELLQ